MVVVAAASIASAVSGIISGLGDLFTSDEERVRAEAAKLQVQLQPHLLILQNAASQIETNNIQANHPSLFVAGPRPALLWVFVAALSYQFLAYPLIEWVWLAFQPYELVSLAMEKCSVEAIISISSETRGTLKESKELCMSIYLKTAMPPSLNLDEMWPLISGLLGLAGWRTVEKVKGVARENMTH